MDKKIILFGASKLGVLAYEYLKDRYDICYYCDNDINKIGRTFNGFEVISVERLIELVMNQEFLVIISSQYYKEIGEQLVSKGIGKDKIRVFYNSLEYLQTIYDIEDKKEEVKKVIDIENIEYNRKIFSKYNVHLMPDSIYTKTFIQNVNNHHYSNSNLFIIYNHGEKIKYVNVGMYEDVEIIDLNDYSSYPKLFTYIYGCQKLFIHYLSDEVCEILFRLGISRLLCKKYWIIWGGDLYNHISFNMYDKYTMEYIKYKLYYLNAMKYNMDTKKLDVRKHIIKNIDYVLTWNMADYQLVIDNFETDVKHIKFSYNINIDYQELDEISENNDISYKKKYKFKYLFLVGNSATWENNHVDVFYKLKSLDFEDFGVILPLSYGNMEYAKDIINEGRKILGDRIIVLDKFIKAKEYFSIVNEVDAIIMNHIRQQAVGNILGALYLGKQVYMNKKSNIYKFYNEINLEVYNLEELCKEKLSQKDRMDLKEKREIIINMFDYDYSNIIE